MNYHPLQRISLLCAAVLILGNGIPLQSQAATGVSDERVVLPDGPGSIGGVGENAEIDPNMGQMSYSVPIEIPAGYAGMTPSLSLSYSSGNGSSEVGIGWRMSIPYIERMSLRGLPEYRPDDEFAVNGSDELVRVAAEGETQVYRARFEKAFVRYTWHAVGAGGSGYWTAEYPDGSIGYFGADETGVSVDTARVSDAAGNVFRFHLVASVDTFGHRIVYDYIKTDSYALLSGVGYAYGANDTPRFSMALSYEVRQDIISDCVPGFNLLLDQRLSSIQIFSGAEQIRQYVLTYEDYATSGGFSRLALVQKYGRNGVLHPIQFSFAYSRALVGAADAGSGSPYMVDMGSLPGGVDISTGMATLLDINGDALPDFLSSTPEGAHRFYLSALDATHTPTFSTDIVESTSTVGGSAFILSAPGVQVLDVNGDGFTDIISSRTGTVLCNNGSGDWAGTACLTDSTLPQMDEDEDDAGEGDPLHVRFMDYDNDKRIDMMRTLEGLTEVFYNNGSAFVQTNVQDIGAVFDDTTLQLADMNGDNLQDPVQVLTDMVRYRLNLGFGNWSDWNEVPLEGIDETAALAAQLEDLNGDGLADLVIVAGNEVRVAVNRNGARFDAITVITSADVTGDLPERTAETTVLFADMNGNGSDDIMWVTNSGSVRFLELFPVKPNLLSRIENGIGYVQTVSYDTSVAEQSRDKETQPWRYKLPHAMNVVSSTDTWTTLTGAENGEGLHEQVMYRYHHGFYDGEEKQFRGYAAVESIALADENLDSQEAAQKRYLFDVGSTDPYYNGLLLQKNLYGGVDPALYPINEERYTYGDCEVAGVPTSGLAFPVRHICPLESTQVIQEGAAAAEWVTTRTEQAHDGYGNVISSANYGVVHYGPPEAPTPCPACEGLDGSYGAPCGAECLGDEEYAETEFVIPGDNTGGRWITDSAYREIGYGQVGGPFTEALTYYDGDPFVGLPLAQLTQGKISRVTQTVDDVTGELVTIKRNAYDTHGNITEIIDPNGDEASNTTHHRRYTYDDLGLKVIRAEILLEDEAGAPYSLVREMTYESAFLKPSEATAWMVEGRSDISSARNSTTYRYDEQGRVIRLIRPGDGDATPTAEYVYELGDPASRIVIRARSVQGGTPDLEEVRCIDGQGREFQRRTKLSEGVYQVTGFTQFNRRGAEVRIYQPYTDSSELCSASPPASVLFTSISYDAANREIARTLPDSAIYGTASVSSTVYSPLATYAYDVEDNDPDSPFYDTPTVEWGDGLGRLVAIERYLTRGETAPATLSIYYDSLGRVAGYEDAAGNVKTQVHDLLGRVLRVDDPNAGTTTFSYDAAGNLVGRQDARGESQSMAYDGANRKVALWNTNDPDSSQITWTYDGTPACADCVNGAGKIVRVTYPLGEFGQGIDEYGYDARGQPFSSSRQIEGFRYETDYTFDNSGRITETTHPDGTVVRNHFDQASRIVAIDGIINSVTYDQKGMLASTVYKNGLIQTFTYDDLVRVKSISTRDGAASVLQGWELTRRRSDNISGTTDISTAREGKPTWSTRHSYDSWYRLLNASIDPEGADAESVSYSYNNIDNILSATSSLGATSPAHVGSYTYDTEKPNAVTQAGDTFFGYDPSGMVTARGDKTFSRDYLGRLTASSDVDGTTGEFLYGPNDQRVAKLENGGVTFYINTDFDVRDGIGTTYARLGDNPVARIENDTLQVETLSDLAPSGAPDNIITAADAWLAHASVEGIVTVTGTPSDVDRILNAAARRNLLSEGKETTFLHQDQLGSLTLATDQSGGVRGERAYYPTGEVRFESGYVDEHGFTGQERDDSTGLLHFQHRYLDPVSGRWMSPDPAFNTVTADLLRKIGESTTAYTYVANNPTNAVDPTGLGLKSVAKAAGGKMARAGTAAGRKIRSSAKKVGRVLSRTGRASGRAILKAGRVIGHALAKTGRATAAGFRKAKGTITGKNSWRRNTTVGAGTTIAAGVMGNPFGVANGVTELARTAIKGNIENSRRAKGNLAGNAKWANRWSKAKTGFSYAAKGAAIVGFVAASIATCGGAAAAVAGSIAIGMAIATVTMNVMNIGATAGRAMTKDLRE